MADNGRTEDAKGRAKEAAGALLDDEDLKNEGRLDQAAAGVKQKAAELVDTLRDKLGGREKESKKENK